VTNDDAIELMPVSWNTDVKVERDGAQATVARDDERGVGEARWIDAGPGS